MESTEHTDVLIIGAGQSGLALGYQLQKRGRRALLVDRNDRIGDSWRNRWDSLKLYSPASRDGLPGLPFPAGRTSYPTKDEMADYLEAYAAHFELPVRLGTAVESLTQEDGRFVADTGGSRIEADNVVVASGVFEKPHIPAFANELDPAITQLHSSAYRNLLQLQGGPVLVVGASHSGSDIAYESAATHEVVLSGRDTGQLPASVETRRGRMLFRGLFFAGSHVLTVDTPIGRKMRPHIRKGGAPLLRYRRSDLRRAGVERVLERTVGVQDGQPVLDGGRVLEVRNVVWCTGFRPDFGWIQLPLEIGEDGYPVQYRGASTTPGLYFVGLPFLHSFTSMLIGGAERDTERVAEQIEAAGSSNYLVWNGAIDAVEAGR
ncbi:MAG TPA: NAD(P)/FAD-dependent oxidoreductase [Gaiellaceae bacterium]|nr:NAD(P)/FAD-dependent oxidoreductase [Gaiellaceae bacterium]